MPKQILVVGGVSYDSIIGLKDFPAPKPHTEFSRSYNETVGSTGAGKALALHRLGIPTTLHAFIGDDWYGQRIREIFHAAQLPFHYEIDPLGTERHTNLMNAQGQRISIYTQYASFEPPLDLGKMENLIAACDVLVLNIINYCRYLIPLAKKHHKPIWCDLHDYNGRDAYHRDFLEAANVVFMSSDALPHYNAFMQQVALQGKEIVVCTHGRDGATLLTQNEWYDLPVLPYELVDTNGAGANFFSAYLYAYLQGYPPEKCLQLAHVGGGLCVTSHEITPPNLSADLLEQEWRRHYGR